jgi:hypothetical protein
MLECREASSGLENASTSVGESINVAGLKMVEFENPFYGHIYTILIRTHRDVYVMQTFPDVRL